MDSTEGLDPMKKIDAEEFAKAVNLSYQTIYRYVKSGKLVPRRTLGGRIYFLIGDIDTFNNHHSSEPLILDGAFTYGTTK